MTQLLTTQIEAKIQEYKNRFGVSSLGKLRIEQETFFLRSALTEIAEVAQEKWYHKGFEDGAEFERVKFGQSNQEGV